ncbi:hypothetical protein DSCO28_39050 [Desulfosarcina ovata subsp. sediminis]|uniref:YbaK/aminoacyl-tRNA synthetase-associated domain-containing protein n=3 Tax=Desulfosarcina ovata TaxID=83564 RepID=A0A5K8AB17_9BACT|nr:hypothetical protein DSCO28_39050 [Desulfosarcina ovata subsp. sediminis]BBO89706.1 hypothetical protein DSCOOX_28860 [Desulfosarcina ovata subsp. ovata]
MTPAIKIAKKAKIDFTIHEYTHGTAKKFASIFVSAGKRGLEIELAPDDLIKLTKGKYSSIST